MQKKAEKILLLLWFVILGSIMNKLKVDKIRKMFPNTRVKIVWFSRISSFSKNKDKFLAVRYQAKMPNFDTKCSILSSRIEICKENFASSGKALFHLIDPFSIISTDVVFDWYFCLQILNVFSHFDIIWHKLSSDLLSLLWNLRLSFSNTNLFLLLKI